MLRSTLDGPRLTLTIDDPDRRNPLTAEIIDGMIDAIRSAPDEVRVIVVTGAGEKAFCAGGDLAGGFFDAPIAQHRQRGGLAELFRLFRSCGLPVVARVNGHALAGGFGLAAACDIVVAVDTATFGTPEIQVGLWPMMISAVLRRSMPEKAALELMLTGRRIDCSEAQRLGVVSRVVAPEDLDNAVDETVAALAAKSRAVIEMGKDAFYVVGDLPLDAALDHLQAGLTLTSMADDAKEGVMAFVEKREPNWTDR